RLRFALSSPGAENGVGATVDVGFRGVSVDHGYTNDLPTAPDRAADETLTFTLNARDGALCECVCSGAVEIRAATHCDLIEHNLVHDLNVRRLRQTRRHAPSLRAIRAYHVGDAGAAERADHSPCAVAARGAKARACSRRDGARR